MIAQEHVFLDKFDFLYPGIQAVFSRIYSNIWPVFPCQVSLCEDYGTSFWTRLLIIVSKVNTSKENLFTLYTWQNEIAKKLDKEYFLIRNQLQQPSSCGDGVRA